MGLFFTIWLAKQQAGAARIDTQLWFLSVSFQI